MLAFSNGLSAVLTVFLIGFLGYVLAKLRWITPEMARVLPKFVTVIVLPPFLVRNIMTTFTRDQFLSILSGLVIPLISIGVAFGIGIALAYLCKINKDRRGIFQVAFATSNTMNIGLPINIALWGEENIPYTLLYFFGNLAFFWTVGNYCIAHDSEEGRQARLISKTTLKQIVSPALVAFFAGVAMVLLDLQLPPFVDKVFKYVGDMALALGLIYVGIMLHSVGFADLHLDKDVLLVFAGRYIISPAVIVALAFIFPMPDAMLKVFITQASLPVMLNIPILAGFYRADVRYATILTTTSTLFAIVTIPLSALLISYFLP